MCRPERIVYDSTAENEYQETTQGKTMMIEKKDDFVIDTMTTHTQHSITENRMRSRCFNDDPICTQVARQHAHFSPGPLAKGCAMEETDSWAKPILGICLGHRLRF